MIVQTEAKPFFQLPESSNYVEKKKEKKQMKKEKEYNF